MLVLTSRCTACETDCHPLASEIRCHSHGNVAVYGFRCSACLTWVTKLTDAAALGKLAQAGVYPVQIQQEQGGKGPRLTADDELDFGLALERLPNGEVTAPAQPR